MNLTETTLLASNFHDRFPEEQVEEPLGVVAVVESFQEVLEFNGDTGSFSGSGAGDGSFRHLERQVGSKLCRRAHHARVEEGL